MSKVQDLLTQKETEYQLLLSRQAEVQQHLLLLTQATLRAEGAIQVLKMLPLPDAAALPEGT